MNIDTFIELFKTGEESITDHIKTDYVPYEKKADVAKAIIDTCCWRAEKLPDGTEVKNFHVDSIGKHMLFCMSLIDLYTDIERGKEEGKMLEDFNKLNECGIFDIIISALNKNEIKEYNMVIQMTYDDLITNEYELHAFVSSQVNRFGTLIGSVLGPVLENVDVDKIAEVISEITNREG